MHARVCVHVGTRARGRVHISISSFIKIRPVGAELFQVDRQKDVKLIVAFRSFVNAPKKIVSAHTTKAYRRIRGRALFIV
jgi:hypothetical protein